MPKLIVGRRVEYLEVFEVDTDKVPSGRDDLDLCERVLCCCDPVYSQYLKSSTERARSSIKFLSRTFDYITKGLVYPVPEGAAAPNGQDESCKILGGE